jgi:hypothetical protein
LVQLRQRTPALLVGDYRWIDTGSSQVYAAVRQYEGQTILTLINLSDAAVSDYAIDLDLPQASGSYTAHLLLGEGDPAGLTLDANGSVKAYQPLAELAPYAHMIIELRPVE